MPLLKVENLSLSFAGSHVLRGVSFALEKGEMLALVGESGSGKSLTALSCLGLQPKNADISGSICFDGKELLATSQQTGEPSAFRNLRGKKISMIFQEPMTALNPLHPIGKQIAEMGNPDVAGLLEKVGLNKFVGRQNAYPHELSGGERQRVMIAMAIAASPSLLIADEPTTALDVTIQANILQLLKDLQKTLNMAMLFITHDLTLVRRLADRVAVMCGGEIVEQGKVDGVFAKPQHEYTQLLLASEPKGSPLPCPKGAKTILECHDIKVHFPIKSGLLKRTTGYIKAVDGISINLAQSSTLGVVGESGSGKTTLGFALLRLIKSEGKIIFLPRSVMPDASFSHELANGVEKLSDVASNTEENLDTSLRWYDNKEIRLDNLKTRELRPLRARMQLVFQDPYSSLNPRMTVGQIIAEGLLVHYPEKSPAEREAEIDKILQEVGLSPDIKRRYPHEFSGGQRQRISIARAMVLKPELVVLDEPTSALDLSVQGQIIELLKHFQKTRGLSYVFISHDLRVIRAIAQNIIVMKNGKVMEQGNTAEIFNNPQHEYTKSLIEAAFL